MTRRRHLPPCAIAALLAGCASPPPPPVVKPEPSTSYPCNYPVAAVAFAPDSADLLYAVETPTAQCLIYRSPSFGARDDQRPLEATLQGRLVALACLGQNRYLVGVDTGEVVVQPFDTASPSRAKGVTLRNRKEPVPAAITPLGPQLVAMAVAGDPTRGDELRIYETKDGSSRIVEVTEPVWWQSLAGGEQQAYGLDCRGERRLWRLDLTDGTWRASFQRTCTERVAALLATDSGVLLCGRQVSRLVGNDLTPVLPAAMPIRQAACSADGSTCAVVTDDAKVRVFRGGRELRNVPALAGSARCTAVSRDGTRIAIGYGDDAGRGNVLVVDLAALGDLTVLGDQAP